MTDTNLAVAPPESLRSAVWAQFRKHKGAVFGLVVLTLLILFSVVGPLVCRKKCWPQRSNATPQGLGIESCACRSSCRRAGLKR